MKIIKVQERKEIEIPFSDIYENGKLNINPELQYKKYLDVTIRSNRAILIAGKYIGLIPINNKYSINVTAKVPVSNFIFMLTCAKESPEIIQSLERLYTSDSNLNIFELLVNAFHKELRTIEQNGYYRDYVHKIEDRTDFKGKLDVKQTAIKYWSKNIYNHAVVHYFEYSRDVTINRIIYYTLWFILNIYPSIAEKPNVKILTDFNHAIASFSHVTLDKSRSFLNELQNIVLENRLPYSRLYLKQILHLSYMLLSNLGVDLDYNERADILLPPLVINMETIFQKYLFNTITSGYAGFSDIACVDTTKISRNKLFKFIIPPAGIQSDFKENEYAEPDFVIKQSGTCKLVCDAKYKVDYHRSDIYQIVTHALAYGVKNALIIYPSDNANQPPNCTCLGVIGSINVYVFHYPLDSADLEINTNFLIKTINTIIE